VVVVVVVIQQSVTASKTSIISSLGVLVSIVILPTLAQIFLGPLYSATESFMFIPAQFL
jgi:hypothetical protein